MTGYLMGLPAFLAWFGCGAALMAAFVFIYTGITAHNEMKLIREGNVSAAIALGGALVGFSLPLGSAAANTATVQEFFIWAVIGLIVQLLAYFAARLLVPGLSAQIAEKNVAASIWAAGIAISVGILNANCMTY